MRSKEPINSGVIRLFVNKNGEIDGEMSWTLADDLDQELVDALVEVLHGIMGSVQTRFDELRQYGKVYQAGMETEACRNEITFEPEKTEEDLGQNVVTFNPSTRKH